MQLFKNLSYRLRYRFSNNSSNGAFTLIELIVVITIIGVMTGFLVFDFAGAKQQHELSAIADQAIALIQQSHAEVAAGKVRIDEVLNEDVGTEDVEGATSMEAVALCIGAHFEVGSGFQMMTADYVEGVGVAERGVENNAKVRSCDFRNATLEDYGMVTGGSFVGGINLGTSELDELWVYFIPPEGEIVFDSGGADLGNGADLVGDFGFDAVITFTHEGDEEKAIYMTLNSLTNKASLSRDNEGKDFGDDDDDVDDGSGGGESDSESITKNK